ELGPIARGNVVAVLEREPAPMGEGCFEVHAAERLEGRALPNRGPPFVHEPQVSAVLELGPMLALGAPDLVDGVVDELDGMEFVEGDLGFGEVVVDTLDVGRAHVDTHLLDAGGI